jgi:stage III sporulation protein SpoIIIAA
LKKDQALQITDDLEKLLDILPPEPRHQLQEREDLIDLIEVVLDLGRYPEARFPGDFEFVGGEYVTREDIAHVVSRLGRFGKDNRAGIERTLHRISAIRNRAGDIVGLTLRVGRAVYGTIHIIRDIVESGRSILLLGRPGVGKTTMLREIARVLADELRKRVVIVDTSNEIAGDGDVPHPGIGHARRMQVPQSDLQHAVMIEAVENHMPEVIVVDEIGTEQEAYAARTIAERGVQLVATAHGTNLESLLQNPTLSDLVGGIQPVTLSDEEARRRGTQKTVLERKAPPTFDVLIEIQDKNTLVIHDKVEEVVDMTLRGALPKPEIRQRDAEGHVEVVQHSNREEMLQHAPESPPRFPVPPEMRLENARIFPYAVSRNRLERAITDLGIGARIVRNWDEADVILTLKGHERRESRRLREKSMQNIPVYVLKSNTVTQIQEALRHLFRVPAVDAEVVALREAEEAIQHLLRDGTRQIELRPQGPAIRRLQHQLVEQHPEIRSRSKGAEPRRRVLIYRDERVTA